MPSRNHLAALIVARRLSENTGENVTVFDYEGRKGARLLSEIGFGTGKLRVLNKMLAYPDYLREMARHKIVLQLDTSFVPGQIAGDALLCRIPCAGGNGAIMRTGFDGQPLPWAKAGSAIATAASSARERRIMCVTSLWLRSADRS